MAITINDNCYWSYYCLIVYEDILSLKYLHSYESYYAYINCTHCAFPPRYLSLNSRSSLLARRSLDKCTCCLSINNFYYSFEQFEVAQTTNTRQTRIKLPSNRSSKQSETIALFLGRFEVLWQRLWNIFSHCLCCLWNSFQFHCPPTLRIRNTINYQVMYQKRPHVEGLKLWEEP